MALSRKERSEALAWLEDCFEDMPAELTDGEVVAAVSHHYEGGWAQFLLDGPDLLGDDNETKRSKFCTWCDDPSTNRLAKGSDVDYGCDFHTLSHGEHYDSVEPIDPTPRQDFEAEVARMASWAYKPVDDVVTRVEARMKQIAEAFDATRVCRGCKAELESSFSGLCERCQALEDERARELRSV